MVKAKKNPVETKESTSSSWNEGIRLAIIVGIITLITGFIAYVGYTVYDNIRNKAILSFNIKSLTIVKNSSLDWTFLIVLDQINTGNSEAIYSVNGCDISLPHLQNSPFRIKYEKKMKLDRRDFKNDTLEMPLPFKLESSNPFIFDSLQYIKLTIKEKRTGKKFYPQRKQNEVTFQMGSSFKPETGFMTGKTKDSLNMGIHSVLYHNKVYNNSYSPKTANVTYNFHNPLFMFQTLKFMIKLFWRLREQ